MTYRTRFAPSPTGYLHVGGARTALYCWLQAKKEGGEFVLRIEDTDRERSTQEAVDVILESMEWLNLNYASKPVFQTDRFDRYQQVVDELLDQGHAYRCYCTREELDEVREQQRKAGEKPRYNRRCRHQAPSADGPGVVRFAMPLEGVTQFADQVHGHVTFNNNELDDLILVRSDGTPTYNLTVVVDDFDMGISHVIRGDDHINNTPKQINLLKAIDATPPVYAHVPMILGEDGARLSKRHGAVSVLDYRRDGFLPEALLNYLVRLGWSHGDQELFTIDELLELFDVADVNKAASTFNPEKLLWINKQHMQSISTERLAGLVAEELRHRGLEPGAMSSLERVVEVFVSRASTVVELVDGCAFIFTELEGYDQKAAKTHLRPVVLEPLVSVSERLASLEEWEVASIETAVTDTVESFDLKFPKLAQPIRVAVAGKASSPGIGETLELLGKESTLARLNAAIEFVRQRAGL